MHRNTYLNAPACLAPSLELRARPGVYLAGQLSGVEGYVESAALGLVAGVHAAFAHAGAEPPELPGTTAHGALLRHLREADPAPLPADERQLRAVPAPRRAAPGPARERNRRLAERALADLARFAAEVAA